MVEADCVGREYWPALGLADRLHSDLRSFAAVVAAVASKSVEDGRADCATDEERESSANGSLVAESARGERPAKIQVRQLK